MGRRRRSIADGFFLKFVKSSSANPISRLIALGRPPVWTLIVAPIAIIVTSSLSVLPPLFIGRIIDGVQHAQFETVLHQLSWYAVIALMLGVTEIAEGYSSTVFRETMTRNFRLRFIEKLGCVQLDALARLTAGEINNRMTADIDNFSVQLQYSLFPTVMSLVTLAATLVVLFRINVAIAVVSMTFSMLTLIPMRIAARRSADLQGTLAAANDEFYGELADGTTLQGLALFRNPHAAVQRFARFGTITQRILNLGAGVCLVEQWAGFAQTILGILGPAATMALGAYLCARGQISTGEIVSVLIYQSRMAGPFRALSFLQLTFATIAVTARRLFDVLDLPNEKSGKRDFAPGRLVIENISMLRDRGLTLRGATLAVDTKSHVALVGPSGAGKSTLASLLMRLSEPSGGSISIGATQLADTDLRSLRKSVAIVAQDPLIFDAPLIENLRLTKPDCSLAEITSVLELCALDDLVARLPDGLGTRLGQRGSFLSGGERQRVCLARAVLQDPAILILDEALSGVDGEMESRILARLRARFRDRMIIAITHRLRSVRNFDRIFMMAEGRIVGSGAYADLSSLDALAEAL